MLLNAYFGLFPAAVIGLRATEDAELLETHDGQRQVNLVDVASRDQSVCIISLDASLTPVCMLSLVLLLLLPPPSESWAG